MENIQSELNLIKAEIKSMDIKYAIQEKRIEKMQKRIDEIYNRLGLLENNTNGL